MKYHFCPSMRFITCPSTLRGYGIAVRRFAVALAAFIGATLTVVPLALAQGAPRVTEDWFVQSRLATPISVTNASAATLLPTSGLTARLCNTGTADAYVAFGASSITVTTASGSLVQAGSCSPYALVNPFTNANYTYIATISATSTTLYVETGTGTPPRATNSVAISGSVTALTPDVRASSTVSSGTLNAAVSVALNNGEGITSFAVSGITGSAATMTIEASDDGGTTWSAVNGIAPSTGALFSTFTTDQQFRVNTGGRTNVRVRVSTNAGAQTITVATSASSVSSAVALSSPLPAGTNNIGGVTATQSASITNPTSTLALPSTTTGYTAGNLICSSATVATCNTALASTFFPIPNVAGGALIPRLRLTTNDATATAWGAQTITVDLWTAAPTFATSGDRASFTTDFLTGSAGHIAAYTCVMSAELADGAYAECAPTVGQAPAPRLASGTSIFWTATATTGSGTTGASKTFTLTAELLN